MIKNCLLAVASLLAISLPAAAQKILWASVYAPDYAEVKDVSFGKDTYVAVGTDGTVLHSKTGRTWTKGKLPEGISCDLNTVEFAFGQFWAGGQNLDTNKFVILLSLDGVNWADVSADYFKNNDDVLSIREFLKYSTAGKEVLFLGYTENYYERINNYFTFTTEGVSFANASYYGENLYQAGSEAGFLHGSYWNKVKNINASISYESNYLIPADLTRIAYGNSFYVGVGAGRKLGYWNGKTSGSSYKSQFTYATSPAISNYTGVAFGEGCFAAVGTNGALVNSFDNGKSWVAVTNLNLGTIDFNGIKFVGGKFLAFGGGRILFGEPAKQRAWSAATLPSRPQAINSIATNGKIAVAVGAKGQILFSTTGRSWSKAPPMTSNNLLSVDYDATTKLFYATGAAGTILTSPNGTNWTVRKTNITGNVYGVARMGGLLYAGGASGSFQTTVNGITWKSNPLSTLNSSYRTVSLGTGAGLIENPTTKGQVWIHRGGTSKWTALKSPAATGFGDAQVFNGTVYLGGLNGKIYSSPQKTVGGSWKTTDTRTTNPIQGLGANANILTAVGTEGLVYTLFKDNKWRIENIMDGAPNLKDTIFFNKLWIAAGSRGGNGFVAFTTQD